MCDDVRNKEVEIKRATERRDEQVSKSRILHEETQQ